MAVSEEWPYPDLDLKCPHCPYCGAPARMMLGPGVHPMAFCTADGCPCFTWDPSKAAAELLPGEQMVIRDGEGNPVDPDLS